MQTQTLKEAKRLKMAKYFTGRPCRKGHRTLRYTNTGACIACISAYARERRNKINQFSFWVQLQDKHDIKAVKEFVDALNMAREFMKPVE